MVWRGNGVIIGRFVKNTTVTWRGNGAMIGRFVKNTTTSSHLSENKAEKFLMYY